MDPFRTQEPILRLAPRTPGFYIFLAVLSIQNSLNFELLSVYNLLTPDAQTTTKVIANSKFYPYITIKYPFPLFSLKKLLFCDFLLAKLKKQVYTPPVRNGHISHNGVLAQLVEHFNGIEGVSGSSPLCSSLRFFGEKTSAWQAFGVAKPTFLLRVTP